MMAPLNFSAPPAKPKIGFSIDSIVGDDSSPEKPPPARQPTVTSAPQGSPPRSPGSPAAVRRGAWSPPAPVRPRSPLRSRSPLWPRSPMHSPKSASAELESAKLAAFQQQLQQLQLQRLHAPEPLHPALRPGLHALSLPHPLASLPRPPVSAPAGQPLPAAFGPAALGVGVGVGGLPPQTEYPLLPWLYSRQGRIFPSRFPGPDFPAFLLQPFRKPKRIRTAFSPSQLLKLEHAFENNHYVVGQERKQLAQSLNLSETQVKVWFQNRRTKHKRVQEEEGPAKSPGAAGDADAGDEQADSLLTYDASDDDNIDVDADGDKATEVAQ